VPIACSLGAPPLFAYIETLTAAEKALAIATAGVVTTTFAYLLNALRPTITRLWCGNMAGGPLKGFAILGEFLEYCRYDRIRTRADGPDSVWMETFNEFRDSVLPLWSHRPVPIPAEEVRKLNKAVAWLRPSRSPETILKELNPVIASFSTYDGDSLKDVFNKIKKKLVEQWYENDRQRHQDDKALLDRSFSSSTSIRATRLGNYIESSNYYPFKRYGIEPEIFWHRLERVMKKEDVEAVDDQRTLLDFALTMATLSVVYLVFSAFAGPWFWYFPALWTVLVLLSACSALLFYQLGVIVAYDLGDRVRASFDLNRLTLMKALGRKIPEQFSGERRQWEELSRLAVYGETSGDFDITPPGS
jgi:hypothetical protein